VLVLRYVWRDVAFVTVHNFSDKRHTVRFDVNRPDGAQLFDVFDENHSRADAAGRHRIQVGPYWNKWYRVGASDTTPKRSVRI
jgi:maltose alpha-D-glucosyltransferase/alpha-amylase